MKKIISIFMFTICMFSFLVTPHAAAFNFLENTSLAQNEVELQETSLETATARTIKVACIGDSITYGSYAEPIATMSYPAQLQNLLGDKYLVGNFGFAGRAMNDQNEYKYIGTGPYNSSIAFEPDVVIIMLGTCDSKNKCWDGVERYKESAATLVRSYRALASQPEIYFITAPALADESQFPYVDKDDLIRNTRIASIIAPTQREIAPELGGVLIDINLKTTEMANNGKLGEFLANDKVHPNNYGYGIIATDVYDAIMSQEHVITTASMQNGTVIANKSAAKAGEMITLTVLPDEGYRLVDGSLQVNGFGITGSSFSMPGLKALVSARFEKISTVSGQVRSDNPVNKTTIRLYASTDTEHATALYTTTIAPESMSGQQTQTFSFADVTSGTYDLVVTKVGYLPYTISGVVVNDTDLDLKASSKAFIRTMVLIAGDLNNDGRINYNDIYIILDSATYNQTAPFSPLADINDDGRVNVNDVNIIYNTSSLNKTIADATFIYEL